MKQFNLLILLLLFFSSTSNSTIFAQCNNTYSLGGGVAPSAGSSLTISTCNWAGDYATVTGVAAATNYRATSTIATTFITVRRGTPGGVVIASGVQPLNWTSTLAGTYYIHFNTNAACGTASSCMTTTLQNLTGGGSGCTNTFSLGSAVAPVNASVTITTCNYAGDYATVSAVTAATQYTSSTNLVGGYFTIHQGTFNGPVVGFGLAPLTWTSTVAGNYYIHLNTNAACGTDATCHTNVLSNSCAVVPLAPTLVSASPTSMCLGNSSNLSATSVGNTIRWYTVSSGGTNIGTSASTANFAVSPSATTTYYAEAYTAGGCASSTRTSVTVTITGPAAPTAVSATPTTVCPGVSSNLVGTSAGNTIRWYTVSSGGTNVGTSASGANFSVSPVTTTTYYAEAYTGAGCASLTRTSVVVNVGPGPSAPTNVSATPTTICSGSSSNVRATANSTGFTGLYAPGNWTISRTPATDAGSVNAGGAPTSISMTSSNNGLGGTTSILYTTNITTSGSISFNWAYTTVDGSAYDYPQYAINGVIIGLIPGFSGGGANTQSGSCTIAVTAGQTFSLVMTSVDNGSGAATTTFSSFSGPGNGTNTVRWYTTSTGGSNIGTSASGANFSVSPATTTTYYAESYTSVGCASATRTPITVYVEVATVPNPVTASPSTICVGASTNLNATSGTGSSIINGFTSFYAPSNWTLTHAPVTDQGTINTSGAPGSISFTSSDGGSWTDCSVIYTVTAAGTGNITFSWNYLTTDVNGSAYDLPEYYINGVVVGLIPGFVSGGPDAQSGTSTIPITAGQTFSLALRGIDDILGPATITYTNFTAPGAAQNTIRWYTVSTGGSNIGTSANGANFPVTPGATITYYAEAITPGLGCISTSRTPVTVTVNTFSTQPLVGALQPSYCPNSTITLTAGSGTAGSGSNIYWYTGANGTGTFVGTGTSINVTPTANTTYYIRREGTCNTTTDDVGVVVLKNYIYAANGTSSTTYCTDNSGWQHFFVGNDIILSVVGDLSTAGTVTASIGDNNAYYLDPGTPAACAGGTSPGEAQFEMERNWNVDYTGVLIGSYDVRYYFEPAEKAAVITAANNWMSTYGACSYTYKYPNPSGWFWFKNSGSAYTAPDYDDDPTMLMLSTSGTGATPNGINYAIMSGITGFSGGTGAVVLIPDPLLNVKWLYFDGVTDNKTNFLRWATESEKNASHFNIQRSKDGTNFSDLGSVAAKGNSTTTQHYTFDDKTPFGGDNYYRLELVDNDGQLSYSNVIRLAIKNDNTTYSFYPNPTNGVVNYEYEASAKEPLKVEVIDIYGRTLYNNETTSQVGLNQLPINLTEYPVGSYVLRVTHLNNGQVHSSKVIRSGN